MIIKCGAERLKEITIGSSGSDFFINETKTEGEPRGLERFIGSGAIYEAKEVVENCRICVGSPDRECDLSNGVIINLQYLVPQTT